MNRQDASGLFPEPDRQVDDLAGLVVDAATEVHRVLGPGFIESVYEEALAHELDRRAVRYERQRPFCLFYKGVAVGDWRLDLLVEHQLVVELKAASDIAPVHLVQVRSYLKATDCKLGLLINFNVAVLQRGVRRVVLSPP